MEWGYCAACNKEVPLVAGKVLEPHRAMRTLKHPPNGEDSARTIDCPGGLCQPSPMPEGDAAERYQFSEQPQPRPKDDWLTGGSAVRRYIAMHMDSDLTDWQREYLNNVLSSERRLIAHEAIEETRRGPSPDLVVMDEAMGISDDQAQPLQDLIDAARPALTADSAPPSLMPMTDLTHVEIGGIDMTQYVTAVQLHASTTQGRENDSHS